MLGTDIDRAAKAINEAQVVALACHETPDGDALGSMLGLHHMLRAAGRPSVASWSEPFVVAPHYQFLPGLDLVTKPDDFPSEPEVMVALDCSSARRLGGLEPAARAAGELVVLDHHASNDRFGTINVVDENAAATAVLVRRLADRLGLPMGRDAALCLYTGIVTDTGRFQYANTTPEVFALAEELASYDIPIAEVTRQLFEEHRFESLQLLAKCVSRAELDRDLGFVASWVTSDDLDDHHVGYEETEGLIDLVRRTSEADVSCVLKETPEGIRGSLRAISDADVAAVAARFGGGGHRLAAGFLTRGTIPEVLDAVKQAVADQTRGSSDPQTNG